MKSTVGCLLRNLKTHTSLLNSSRAHSAWPHGVSPATLQIVQIVELSSLGLTQEVSTSVQLSVHGTELVPKTTSCESLHSSISGVGVVCETQELQKLIVRHLADNLLGTSWDNLLLSWLLDNASCLREELVVLRDQLNVGWQAKIARRDPTRNRGVVLDFLKQPHGDHLACSQVTWLLTDCVLGSSLLLLLILLLVFVLVADGDLVDHLVLGVVVESF